MSNGRPSQHKFKVYMEIELPDQFLSSNRTFPGAKGGAKMKGSGFIYEERCWYNMQPASLLDMNFIFT